MYLKIIKFLSVIAPLKLDQSISNHTFTVSSHIYSRSEYLGGLDPKVG